MKEMRQEQEVEEKMADYATRQEVEAAIAALTPIEKKKLMVIAMYWSKKFRLKGTEIEADDLLQEAVLRTLKEEDNRKWPKNIVSFVRHLDRCMESIASHHRARMKTDSETKKTTRSLDPPEISKGVSPPAPTQESNAESQVSARAEIEDLRKFFGEDTQAFRAIYCRALGMDVNEIQEDLGINSREWETVRKRVQRKLAAYLQADREEQ